MYRIWRTAWTSTRYFAECTAWSNVSPTYGHQQKEPLEVSIYNQELRVCLEKNYCKSINICVHEKAANFVKYWDSQRFPPVMCESGFGFESGFKAFWAGFGFGFIPKKHESGFGFEKNKGGLESRFKSGFGHSSWGMGRIRIRIWIRTSWIRIQDKGVDSDASQKGGFGFEVRQICTSVICTQILRFVLKLRTSPFPVAKLPTAPNLWNFHVMFCSNLLGKSALQADSHSLWLNLSPPPFPLQRTQPTYFMKRNIVWGVQHPCVTMDAPLHI